MTKPDGTRAGAGAGTGTGWGRGAGAGLALLFLLRAGGACTASDPIFHPEPDGQGGSAVGLGGRQMGGASGTAGYSGPITSEGGFDGGGGRQSPGVGGATVDPYLTGGASGSIGGATGFGGMFQTGGTAGSGSGGTAGTCGQVTSLSECEGRADCYSVFFDPGNCGCAASGCCAHFHHCSDGFVAACAGQVTCAVSAPHCESPYLVSFINGCYEGCVHNKDCAP
jgi:hypothetical protein